MLSIRATDRVRTRTTSKDAAPNLAARVPIGTETLIGTHDVPNHLRFEFSHEGNGDDGRRLATLVTGEIARRSVRTAVNQIGATDGTLGGTASVRPVRRLAARSPRRAHRPVVTSNRIRIDVGTTVEEFDVSFDAFSRFVAAPVALGTAVRVIRAAHGVGQRTTAV